MAWHSDNEPLYGPAPTIGSVSLGATRDFVLRRNADHADKVSFALAHGDVLVMRGSTQLHWTHAVPKRLTVPGARVNLTFRRVVQPEHRP